MEPDKNFVELREMAIAGTIDLLRGFSDAPHDEFETSGQYNFERDPAVLSRFCGRL